MRNIQTVRIFGYGSLMNSANLAERVPGVKMNRWAWLGHHQAVFAKAGSTHVYLTLQEKSGTRAAGVLIDVDPPGLAVLVQHEPGYKLVDVTNFVSELGDGLYLPDEPRVYAFIAPALALRSIPPRLARIKRSYWKKCIADMDGGLRAWWERTVIVPAGVHFDEGV